MLEGEKPSDSYVQSLARGLAVIRSFSAARPAQTLSQIAQATGLTRAGARRIVLTLEKLGYISSDERVFRLTPRILQLGFSYLGSMPYWEIAQPILTALGAKINQNCSIAVRDGHEVTHVIRVPARRIMTTNMSVGSRLPAHCTATGRALMMDLDESELAALFADNPPVQYTPFTKTDVGELIRLIAACRAQGWALVSKELDNGLISIAAPVRNRQGAIVAAVNIGGSASTYGEDEFRDLYLDFLLETAGRIAESLV